MIIQANIFSDATSFLEGNLDWLMIDEAFNSYMISTALMIRDGSRVFESPFFFANVTRESQIVGCAVGTKTDGLLVSEMDVDCVGALAECVSRSSFCPSRVCGQAQAAGLLIRGLERATKTRFVLERTWNIYCLNSSVLPADNVAGFVRKCGADDEGVVRRWSKYYAYESPAHLNIERYLLRKLYEENLYVWDDDGPKGLSATSAPTPNSIGIAAVYTPARSRRRGYASAMVAALSNRLLTSHYKFVTLSAVDGHSSENIYQALGFKKIGQRLAFVAGIGG